MNEGLGFAWTNLPRRIRTSNCGVTYMQGYMLLWSLSARRQNGGPRGYVADQRSAFTLMTIYDNAGVF